VKYDILKIRDIIGGELFGGKTTIIKHLLIDSRTLTSPENTVFFALKGERNNGHDYVGELYNKNVRNFIISEKIDFSLYNDANFLLVDDSLKALHKLAAFHRQEFSFPVIGITGSNGKTIIKEWLYEILNTKKNIVRNPKSYNSQIGVPLSDWLMNKDNNLGIFEAGMSQFGEMQNLEMIIKPTVGIFTNIGEAHQENFIDFKQKISEKLKLFYNSKALIYSKDQNLIDLQIQEDRNLENCELFTWSTKFPADISISKINKLTNTTEITANYNKKVINIEIPLPMMHQSKILLTLYLYLYILKLKTRLLYLDLKILIL